MKIDSDKITERLLEEIEIGMSRIKKKNPDEKILKISCNKEGQQTICIGNNNTIINWNLDNIDLDYLKTLLEESEIKLQPSFDLKEKLVNLTFIIDYRTKEEIEAFEKEQEELRLRAEEKAYIDEKMDELTEKFAGELDESTGIITKPNHNLKQAVKDFLVDLKQAVSELNLSFTKEVEEKVDELDEKKQKKYHK